jgi:hypothetical protein
MLNALLILLYFGMLTYHTYKVVVERYLPTASLGVTVAMDVLEDMHIVRISICYSYIVLQQHRFYWILL